MNDNNIKLPYGTCDTHHHIYNPKQFKPTPTVSLPWNDERPPHTAEEYLELTLPLGITHNILLATSAYGYNYECDLDALEKLGVERTRAILMLSKEVTDEELQRLHEKGVRGSRAYLSSQKEIEDAINLAPRFAKLGWNLDFTCSSQADAYKLLKLIPQLPCEIVVSHQCAIENTEDPLLQSYIKLLKEKRIWVKISAIFRAVNLVDDTVNIEEQIARTTAISRELVAAAPDRIIWATDWPFNWSKLSPYEGLETIVNTIPKQIVDEGLYEQILVKNPANLYGFKL